MLPATSPPGSPGLSARLQSTGAGIARPMSAQELCEVVRIAYDPPAALIIDEAHAAGSPVSLTWGEVGPTATQASWDDYRHDSAFSASWTMTGAPRGSVNSSVLSRLLAPHGDIDRKRISLLYRPMDSARAAAVVERDQNNANVRITSGNRPHARALVDARSAVQTAQEEAQGAGSGELRHGRHRHGDRQGPPAGRRCRRRADLRYRPGAAAPRLRLPGHRVRRVPASGSGPAQAQHGALRDQGRPLMARMKLLTAKKAKTVKTAKAPAKEAGRGSRGWTGRGGGMAQLAPVRAGVPGNHGPGLRAVAVLLRRVLAHDRCPARPA